MTGVDLTGRDWFTAIVGQSELVEDFTVEVGGPKMTIDIKTPLGDNYVVSLTLDAIEEV